MQITGILHGARLLQFIAFRATEVLGPAASEDEIKSLIDRHCQIFVKRVFKGGIGKKGKAGLPPARQDQRRDLRGRRAGAPRGLLLDHRLDALPR